MDAAPFAELQKKHEARRRLRSAGRRFLLARFMRFENVSKVFIERSNGWTR
jgi:hypothetical protein